MDVRILPFEARRDLADVERVWREVGWIDSEGAVAALEAFSAGVHTEVARVEGSAECAVMWSEGSMRYVDTDLPLGVIAAVATSRIARKLGLASRLTARALAAARDGGAVVSALGMFEQGFYDRLGFGTGPYTHTVSFDPAALSIDVEYRRPVRLTTDDWREVHAALVRRHRGHGAVVLHAPETIKAELAWMENPFGLGYREDGRLTHLIMGSGRGEHGPYEISWLSYERPDQLMSLLRLVAELGDQVASVRIEEPPELQLQDLIRSPIRDRARTARSPFQSDNSAIAELQFRALDVPSCIAARRWRGPEVRFALQVTDPLGERSDCEWSGAGGDWTVTIGESSGAEPGAASGLPVLRAGIGAFSRMWFGVRPASGLALTGDLSAPPDLLEALDEALRLPPLHAGWCF